MLNNAQPVRSATISVPDRQRRLTLLQTAAVVTIALLTLASYFVLDRTLRLQRDAAAEIELVDRGRMFSHHIANLSAHYALGADDTQAELRRALDGLASTERLLVAGDASRHLVPLHAEPTSAAIGDYLNRARNIAALPPRDARLRASAAAILTQADSTLAAAFDAAAALRTARAQSESTRLRVLALALAAMLLIVLVADALGIVRPTFRRAARLARENDELAHFATTDPLTGVLNEKSLQQRGAIELQRAKRYHHPLSVLAIDPDRLAAIDAAHGSAGSDSVLKAVVSAMFDGTRATDLVGRISNEKFVVLVPDTELADAELLAERLRLRISNLAIPVGEAVVACTVSIGVATAEPDELFFWSIFERADIALYEAQMRGKNRVFVDA